MLTRKRKPRPIPSDGFRRRIVRVTKHTEIIVELDDETYEALKEIARREKMSAGEICSLAAVKRKPDVTLSRAVRTFVLRYFREAATEEGHRKAGHRGLNK